VENSAGLMMNVTGHGGLGCDRKNVASAIQGYRPQKIGNDDRQSEGVDGSNKADTFRAGFSGGINSGKRREFGIRQCGREGSGNNKRITGTGKPVQTQIHTKPGVTLFV